jgi:hypothetical protein
MKSMAGPYGLVTYYLLRTLCKFAFLGGERERERERERGACVAILVAEK